MGSGSNRLWNIAEYVVVLCLLKDFGAATAIRQLAFLAGRCRFCLVGLLEFSVFSFFDGVVDVSGVFVIPLIFVFE